MPRLAFRTRETGDGGFTSLPSKNPRGPKVYGACSRFRDDAVLWWRFSGGACDADTATLLNRDG